MLLVPSTVRANFLQQITLFMLVRFEPITPTEPGPEIASVSLNFAAIRSKASSHLAGRKLAIAFDQRSAKALAIIREVEGIAPLIHRNHR